jgi:hypothetical protein
MSLEIGHRELDVWFKVFVENSLAGIVELFRERLQVGGLVGRGPIDTEAGALRQDRMNHHDRSPVPV